MADILKFMHCGCEYTFGKSNYISDEILGDGSDGNCVIQYDASTCGNYFMEAKEYNFCNFTVCPNVKLRFCGPGVPIIRVKNCFCNEGEIVTRNPFLCASSSFLEKNLNKTLCSDNNSLYECTVAYYDCIADNTSISCTGGAGGDEYICSWSAAGIYECYCKGGDGGNAGCSGGDGCSNDCAGGIGGTSAYANAGGGGGSGACRYQTQNASCSHSCTGNPGCPASADGIGGNGGSGNGSGGGGGYGYYQGGNGGNGGWYGGGGGNSFYGKGGDGGCGKCKYGKGGDSYYGDGGACGGNSIYGDGGSGNSVSIYGAGGLYGLTTGACVWGGIYDIGIFANGVYNGGVINGNGGRGTTCYGSRGSDIYIAYLNFCSPGDICTCAYGGVDGTLVLNTIGS